MPIVTDPHALPFDSAFDGSPPPLVPLEAHQDAGETGILEGLILDDPLPFENVTDERMSYRFTAAPLTLSQLAAVFVELQHGPREAVLTRYQLTEEQFRLAELERRALPSHDPRFVGAWDAACQTYRKWRQNQLG
jgi:hypothetical protein